MQQFPPVGGEAVFVLLVERENSVVKAQWQAAEHQTTATLLNPVPPRFQRQDKFSSTSSHAPGTIRPFGWPHCEVRELIALVGPVHELRKTRKRRKGIFMNRFAYFAYSVVNDSR